MMAYLQDKDLFVLDAWAGADPDVPAADSRRHRVRLAQPLRAQHVHPGDRRREARRSIARSSPSSTRRTSRPIPRRTARAPRSFILVHFGKQAGAHRRHALRRRDQEVDLHAPELHAAAAGRAADALLGQHRRRRATRRSSSASRARARRRCRAIPHRRPDWRRRARLERHAACSTSRAAATRR